MAWLGWGGCIWLNQNLHSIGRSEGESKVSAEGQRDWTWDSSYPFLDKWTRLPRQCKQLISGIDLPNRGITPGPFALGGGRLIGHSQLSESRCVRPWARP
jgi:hypothetical protein